MKANAGRAPRGALLCPEGHGALVDLNGRLYCPSQAHDGRPKQHPLGESPRTPCYFTLDAAEAASRAALR